MNNEVVPALKWKKTGAYFLFILIALLCLTAAIITPSFADEAAYHFPLARDISLAKALDANSRYPSAYPPLPYLIGKLALKLHSSLITLRILNFFVFLGAVMLFYLLAGRVCNDPEILTLLFFLNPYLLKASFIYLMYNWGLLFALAGLYLYFYPEARWGLAAHLFLAAAVLSQQWMLVVVLALMLHELTLYGENKIGSLSLLKGISMKILCLAPAIYLFARWHGLVHPDLNSHALQPTFEHFNAVLANLGLVLFFLVLCYFRTLLSLRSLPLLFLLPLLWLAIPMHASTHGPFQVTGVVSQFSTQLGRLTGIPYKLIFFAFILIGLALLVLMLKRRAQGITGVTLYAVLGLITAFTASARLAASHIYICIPFILLFFSVEISKSRTMKMLMAGQFLIVSITYLIYVVFFRSRGMSF
jgi:hypothetical protein